MILMRGAPGSGKSHLARSLIDQTMDGDYENHIFSTDDFFLNPRTKQYNYSRQRLTEAHEWNQFRVSQRALNGWSPIIIDNTNMKLWEMFPYVQEAVKNRYAIHILEANTRWAKSPGQLAAKNKHKVEREHIERMLKNYEPATVDDLLRAANLQKVRKPTLRQFPEVKNKLNATSLGAAAVALTVASTSKMPLSNQPTESVSTDTEHMNNFADAWNEGVSQELQQQQSMNVPVSKPQRQNSNQSTNERSNNIFELLRDAKAEADEQLNPRKPADNAVVLVKHAKSCPNENSSFQQIRSIFPDVPISLLWDLFEKCNGDPNWTMDILLNENFTDGIDKLKSGEEIERDNFMCNCRSSSSMSTELQQAAMAIPVELLQEKSMPSISHTQSHSSLQQSQSQTQLQLQPQKIPRKVEKILNKSDSNILRRQIEQQFVIGDEHYSDHVRKIRDFRRGHSSTVDGAMSTNVEIVPNSYESEDAGGEIVDNDEIIEIDLGVSFVCQLDGAFGGNAIERENLKDLKTTVFLPRSLGQQLYAIWMESLYNQLEEHRQTTIREDEMLAKELQEKISDVNFNVETTSKNMLNDIVDMTYSWSAYKADENEWRQTTAENLASKLTKIKLCELFPHIPKETLFEVFAANGNQFSKTVDVLKDSLAADVNERVEIEGRRLIDEVKQEIQTVSFSIRASFGSSDKSILLSFRQTQASFKIIDRIWPNAIRK